MEFRVPDRKRREQKPRVLLSCTLCREKKTFTLKCDRGRPCLNCQKRHTVASCHYTQARPTHKSTSRPDSRRTPPQNVFRPSEHSGSGFVHPSHWRALMDDATRQLDINSRHAVESKSGGYTVHLLSGLSQNVSIRDLVADLPPRHVTDRLVSVCLESAEPSLIIIHIPTFQTQYHQFWQSPLTVSPAWLSLLYGVLACGIWIEHFVDPSRTYAELPKSCNVLRESCAVALSRSDLAVPGLFKVEAALMCLGVEYLQYHDSKSGISILLGLSSHLCQPPPTPFEADMRSRAWLLLSVIDNVVASQTGLPRVIYPGLANSPRPRNLLDEDLHPTMSALPSSRSATDTPSQIVYMLALDDLYAVANEISDLLARGTVSQATTLRLSQQLKAVRHNLSPSLRKPAVDHETPTAPRDDIIMQRTLEMVYQRSRCILHRQYLVSPRLDPELESFRTACVNAARRVFKEQSLLFHEALSSPRNRKRAWFGASRSVSECLTAAMMICFAVINNDNSSKASTGTVSTLELIHVLRQTYTALEQTPEPPVEVTKAAETLATMLRWMGHCVCCTESGGIHTHAYTSSRSAVARPTFDDLMNSETGFEMFDWAFWDREMLQVNNVPFLDTF
ncbi:Zn(II)2Cys6 transcription factor [Aspergillus stella-maris]|uniref:Zn(II)2Cys6 transcription factor n=1 Tax=Aspergillus stella-maris TaxID=1810926 RepID=UPI003CCCC592